MKCFVLNDQSERREGLKALLRQIDRRAKFSEAKDWRQIHFTLKRDMPDLMVIDWQHHWMKTAHLSPLLREYPALPVAVLTDDATRPAVDALLDAGVLGVIPRSLEPRLILRALELVLLGGHYVPACVLNPAFLKMVRLPEQRARFADELERHPDADQVQLSPRQHQIMRLVHMGNTNKMIARSLNISEGTVKIHLASVFRLLGATNRAAAVALYNGWQFNKLAVLRNEAQPFTPKPVPGMRSPVPLKPKKTVPNPASSNMYAQLIAAQPPALYQRTEPMRRACKETPTKAPEKEGD